MIGGKKVSEGSTPNLPPPSWSTPRLAGVHTQSDWIQYSVEATHERNSSEMTNPYCGHKLYSNHSDSCCWRYLLSLSLSLDVGRKKDHEYCSCCCRILHTMNEKAIRRSRIVVSPAHTHTLLSVIRLLSKLVSLTSARAIWDHVLELLTLSPTTWSSPKDSRRCNTINLELALPSMRGFQKHNTPFPSPLRIKLGKSFDVTRNNDGTGKRNLVYSKHIPVRFLIIYLTATLV